MLPYPQATQNELPLYWTVITLHANICKQNRYKMLENCF